MDSYNVVFSGGIAEGFEVEAVGAALKKAFGIADEAKIKQLFSGNRVVLKKDLDRGAAWRFKEKLGEMGILAELELVEPSSQSGWLSFEEDATAAEVAPEQIQSVQPLSPAESVAESGLSLQPTERPDADQSIRPAEPVSTSGLSLEPVDQSGIESPGDQQAQESARFQSAEPRSEAIQPNARPQPDSVASVSSLSSTASVAAATVIADENSSGGGSGVSVPPNASGLCWGGFFLGWIWAVFNRSWIGLLGLIPVLSLPIALVLLFKGRDWAWRNKRWQSVEHFNEVQRKWSIAGVVIAVIGSFLWFQFLQDVSEFTEEEALQMQEQREELQDRLETIEDPEQRRQLEAIIKFQQELQTELEKQQ